MISFSFSNMSRCVLGSQRSFEETGRPFGPMMVRTVADEAVTSWTDSERLASLEGEEDEEDPEEDELADEEVEVELSLLVDVVLLTEEARGRAMPLEEEDGVVGNTVKPKREGPDSTVGVVEGCVDDAGPPRGASCFVTPAAADEFATGSLGCAVEDGCKRALATITPFSATTSWNAEGCNSQRSSPSLTYNCTWLGSTSKRLEATALQSS